MGGGEGRVAFLSSVEEASVARALGMPGFKGRKGFACVMFCQLLGDGRALSNLFLLLYVRIRRVQEKEA